MHKFDICAQQIIKAEHIKKKLFPVLHFAGGGVGVGGTERGADGDGYREFDFLDQVSIGAFKKKIKRGLKD